MTNDQQELLRQARDSIAAAKVLLDAGYPGFAASRAYYSMFYAAEALLEGEAMAFSKHSAVIAAFGQHFARTGKAPVEFHQFLIKGAELRHAGDYGPHALVTADQAREQIARAERFLQLAESLIE